MNYKNGRSERTLIAAGGLYLILLGIVFGLIGFANLHGVLLLLAAGSALREMSFGFIALFCAYRCRLTRAGIVSAAVGAVHMALVAKWLFVDDRPVGLWILLEAAGAIFLVVMGVLVVRLSVVR